MRSIILKDEEKVILDFLQKYKCLRLSQIRELLKNTPDYRIDKTISSMQKRKLLDIDEAEFVKVHSGINPAHFQNTINAFWVYLTFIDYVNLKENYPATYPADIFFLKDGEQYEALYIKTGNEYVVNMLLPKIKEEEYDEIEELSGIDIDFKLKYVIGVDSEDSLKKILSYPSVDEESLKRILFIILDFEDPTQSPNRRFVSFNNDKK